MKKEARGLKSPSKKSQTLPSPWTMPYTVHAVSAPP